MLAYFRLERLRLFTRAALQVLAPRTCGACGRGGAEGALCAECLVQASEGARVSIQSAVGSLPVRALGAFSPPLSLAIKQFKYSGRTDLALPLAELWWQRWAASGVAASPVVLVPVPLHARRLVERGYNQSALLANRLARLAGARVWHDGLERTHYTAQQARLTADDRARNLHSAFTLTGRPSAPGEARIVLVDDVVTTGATLRACEAAFLSSDLTISEVWALAQTPRPDTRRPG
jgi:ComF family protein